MTTSNGFSIVVAGRQGQQQILPADVDFTPKKWSWHCVGGPKMAEIQVTGSRDALKELRNWLRFPVKVVSARGSMVWWGYVHEVEIQLAGLTLTASLDRLRNRVKVVYTSASVTIDTGFLDDTTSQADYGVKEHTESLGEGSAAMAAALRTRLLAEGTTPKLKRALAGDALPKATLRCRGWYNRLGWKYYQRLDGRVENADAGSTMKQPIGWGVTGSSNIGTGDYALHGVGDYFNDFSEGHRLVLTGCTNAANNQTYTVAGSTSEEVVTHTHTLSFSIDDIDDPAGDLSGFQAEHWVWVQNSVQNNRFHWIGKADALHIEIKDQIAGELDPEGPTSSVTLTQPQKLSVKELNYTEAPSSATKSIVHKGQRVGQLITLATGMYVSSIQLDLGKAGTPADNFTVEIYADSGGALGTLKTSGTVAGAGLTTELVTQWVALTKVWLAAGNYWIVCRRSSTLSGTSYFLVGMLDQTFSTTKQYDGSVWTPIEPAWSLKFRLWGVDDIGTLAEALLIASQQGMTVGTGYVASVDGYSYMEAPANALDELERLVGVGTATGTRIMVELSPDLALRLYTRPNALTVPNLNLYTATGKQKLTDAAGTDVEPGAPVAAQWVRLADLDADLAQDGGLSPAWVEEAEYDAGAGTWALTFEGERKLADIIKVQQG
jgi:hypothetical protein